MSTDPVQAVREIGREHRPAKVNSVEGTLTCACGHVSAEWDGLELHRAELTVAAARPFIAAEALREAAEAVPPGPHPNGCLALSCGECARRYERDRLREWLRDRADQIEADQ